MNKNTIDQSRIRNVAIIAHVDHGKTTLVDAFLKQSALFRQNQQEMQQNCILDSGELEREKGITIKAKNICIPYKDYRINIIDTPGHADFSGEVERTLNMAEGCLLVVDAQEGPMSQTKFVLKQALALKLKPIVVINKIDKKYAQPEKVLSKLQDLFLSLATDMDQLDFPVFYAIARDGIFFEKLPKVVDCKVVEEDMSKAKDVSLLIEEIIARIPAPTGDINGTFQMQVNALDFDPHNGRYLIGKVKRGSIKLNDRVVVLQGFGDEMETVAKGNVRKIYIRNGLNFEEVDNVAAGEIAAVMGIEANAIGATICAEANPDPLPPIKISPPSIKIKVEANTSPLAGLEGEFVTAKQLEQRLEQEKVNNITLTISRAENGGGYYIAGRGELQLSILLETMRREGYEFQVRKPEIIYQIKDGKKTEPLEEVMIDVPDEYVGTITTALSKRFAEMVNMESENGRTMFIYRILTRNLLGLRSNLLSATKGQVVMSNFVYEYVPVEQQADIYRKGVLISSHTGTSAGYSLNTIQERGDLFVKPGEAIYEGMVVGVNKYENDMEVNPTKQRHQSAVRMKHDEITQTILKPVIPLTLEYALVFIGQDEMLEVTPKNLRLRKNVLQKSMRAREKRMEKKA